MAQLLALLSSIDDRLTTLRAADGITPGLERLLADLCVWVRAGAPPPRCEAERMRARIARSQAQTDPRAGWNEVRRPLHLPPYPPELKLVGMGIGVEGRGCGLRRSGRRRRN